MCEALPVGMLARLDALGADLAAWAATHRDAPLADAEWAVLGAVRSALPDLLGAVVQASTTDLDARQRLGRRACPTCGRSAQVQSWRVRRVQTTCGVLRLERPWFHCRRCRHGWSPVDGVLQVARGAQPSAALHHQVVEVGAATTFAEAERLLGAL